MVLGHDDPWFKQYFVLDAKSVCAALKKVFLMGRTGEETGSRVALAGPNWLQKCFAGYEASLNF